MNKDFFKTNYSDSLQDKYSHFLQKDGYAYAVSKANSKLLLVIDDITNNKENYKKSGGFRVYDGVDCIDFLDKGIMTKYDYNLNYDINYIYNFTDTYEFYNKNRFDFTIGEIKDNEIISSLRKVFYFLQPTLQSRTLVGGGEENTITDPNFYDGRYYLKNGEEYTILKYRSTIYFYIGNVPYTDMFKKEDERTICIYQETIDFDLYKKAIRLQDIKKKINYCTSEMLDYKYNELKSLIKEHELIKTELKQINY